jgi:hypothetical protein
MILLVCFHLKKKKKKKNRYNKVLILIPQNFGNRVTTDAIVNSGP